MIIFPSFRFEWKDGLLPSHDLFHYQRNWLENFSILLQASLLLSTTGAPSSYHDWPVPACPDRLRWWFGELFCFRRLLLFLHQQYEHWHGTLAPTTSQNPATVSALPALLSPASLRPHNNIYFLSTFIIYILVDGSVPTWLPSGCFLRNTGSTCRTWLHFSRRWWSENICETYPGT